MSQFVVGEQPRSYQLYAVSNHFGSLAGGHCKYLGWRACYYSDFC